MKNKVKRLIKFRFYQCKDIENRLNELAKRGLFLEKCGSLFWTFNKGEPKNIKYAVTYFSEGSQFNPDITDNQQTYFEYAEAAGWNCVTQFSQMQIFSSRVENPVPFETDEREKLENIKKCMKKNFLPSTLALIFVFLLNLAVQFNSFRLNPIDFLSNASRLFPAAMCLAVICYDSYLLLDYFLWCKRSARSIDDGGACIEKPGNAHRIIDNIFMLCILGCFFWFLLDLASEGSWFILIVGTAQIPLLLFLFSSSINILKKKKTAAMKNRVISFTILILGVFVYLTLITTVIIQFDFLTESNSDYRTVTWSLTPTESHDYRIYSDELPLTCEDLYGSIDYDYYSCQKTVDSTLFLRKSSFRQDSLPAKDSPPELSYEILEPHFDFVYDLAKEQLLTIPQWRNEQSFKLVDNDIFDTVLAYQEYFGDLPTGSYVLFFQDKIITLNMEEAPTHGQIGIIKEAEIF